MTCTITGTPDPLLTETEAAKLLGFSKNTLLAWRVTGGPVGIPHLIL